VTAPAPPKPRDRTDEFSAVTHVYEPHRVGLPPLGPYVRELWRRREFLFEMSRTDLRSQHFNTVFGQLWLVLNPLLLACVYFILVDILRRRSGGLEFFAHLMGSLFVFHFVTDAIRQAVKSVTGGGRLILNTAFPRVMLPGASVLTTSALTGPSTMAHTSRRTTSKSRPVLATSDGLVVTPSRMPQLWASRISPTSAVSMKSFIVLLLSSAL